MLQITSMPDSAVLLDVLVSVNRLHSTLQQRVTEMLGSTGLSLSQWLLLCHLRHAAAGTLTEIAATLHRDIGGLSRAAHLLQLRRLISVTRGAEDRRSVRLSISAPGIALCESLDQQMTERLTSALIASMGLQSVHALRYLMEGAAASLT